MIINCSECGKEISDNAESCPHCGLPIKILSKRINIGKKIIVIACAVIILIAISIVYLYQNYGKPKDLSEDAYNYGIKILNVCDDYIDGKISYNNADSEIDFLSDKLDEIYDEEYAENSKYAKGTFSVIVDTSTFVYYMFDYNSSDGKISELINERNELAETLNKKKR